ncbi:Serine/threonine protein kinase [Geodermatophilus telluris]|uniref:non-specific serine/threonine protein kinase n=1 Tax=Geodermatophilus telluris TaxID=1190417 RepID=A0A1G6MMW3_9ACTN|nr:serine/threonine-protein kinase [Geodermatophilus telluris]SDC56567.1 Serine/threonine protein kinase [Geodermatophilus telluris]
MELTAGTVFAGYRVLRQLGVGGMGSVYLVQHPRLPRQDAMKVIHPHLSSAPGYAARFEREAELACTLDHPALVRVHDRGCDEGRLWLTMQFVDGADVDQVLRREGPMTPARAVGILEAVADGLDHAHAMGLVHRDVKPANILLSKRGVTGERAFLGDFGIAHTSEATRQLTDTGALLASLPYAAPEQLLERPVTGAVDVYALGCVVFELLTGQRVFPHASPLVLMGAVLAGPRPETWDALPPGRTGLREVLQRALAADPADRPPSCTTLAAAVRDALAPVPTTVGPAPVPAPTPVPSPAPAGVGTAAHPDPWSDRSPQSSPPPPGPPSWPPQPAVGSPAAAGGSWDGRGTTDPGPQAGPGGWAGGRYPTDPYPGGPHPGEPLPGGPYAGGPYPGGPYAGGTHPGGPPPDGSHTGGARASGTGSRAPRRWPWLLAVLLLLAAAAVGIVVWRPWALDRPPSLAADAGAEGVELRWQPVEGAVAYEVHRDGVLLDRSDATTYLDTGAGSGARVTYSVAAVAGDGERSALTTGETVVSALHPVGDLTAEVVMTGVALSWTAVDNAERYEVHRDDDVLERSAAGSSFLDEDPPPGTHDYSVVAVDEDGDAPSSTASLVQEVSPWLAAADLAAAFRDLLPETPGPGGWSDATCQTYEPRSSSPAAAGIACTYPSGLYLELTQYPDQAALEERIAQLDEIADPSAPQGIDGGGWYRQGPPGTDRAWEAWGFVQPERRLMEVYVEWVGHSIADLDAAFYNTAPY